MGRALDKFQQKYNVTGEVIGSKKNCLLMVDGDIIKEVRYTPGMAQVGYHGFGNELHVFTFNNELHWLKKMKDLDFVSTLIDYDRELLTIKMTYSGESISKENIPDNWEKQCFNILDVLNSKNCSHNDIKPEDILVHEGKLKLIDFGWASKIGDDIPSNWPTCIGGNFRYSSEKFDDSYSLFKSMESINE